ncbi:MAG: DUF6777 domain-containing protein [Actinomycetota bacterium]
MDKRLGWAALAIGVVGILAAATMAVALVSDDGDDGDGLEATPEGFVIEPVSSVGPDAFTPPVITGDERICDKDKLLRELQGRPEALRAWAGVLGLSEDQVPAFIDTLAPKKLERDTMVTNHGLHNGVAYARPSLLPQGTEVLVTNGLIPTDGTTTTSTTRTPTTTTILPPDTPVTRCRCGNPLLPPYGDGTPTTTTTTMGTTTTTTPRTTTTTTTSTTTTTTTPPQSTTTTQRAPA